MWQFPIKKLPGEKRASKAGTKIDIFELNEPVKARIASGALDGVLTKHVGIVYSLFLGRYVEVKINNTVIEKDSFPLAVSEELAPTQMNREFDDVDVTIVAGLGNRINNQWNEARAGWYLYCNGRAVVFADTSEITGWGVQGRLPKYMPKFRGFVGAVFFSSDDPEKLPWTTTKRGINKDSNIYQNVVNEMVVAARPVLSYLNSFYSGEEEERPEARDLATQLSSTDIRSVVSDKKETVFQPPKRKPLEQKRTVGVQYNAKTSDIERAKKAIGNTRWGAGRVGKYALDYFLKQECDDEY